MIVMYHLCPVRSSLEDVAHFINSPLSLFIIARTYYCLGRGAPTMGRFANSGRFLIDPKKFADNTFVCPPLEGFELKAYVALSSPRVRAATQATR